MEREINIVTDGGCDICADMLEKSGLKLSCAPLSIQLGDKTFVCDANLNTDSLLDSMNAFQGVPTTAAPSAGAFHDAYSNTGSTFAVTISSHLSGSYNIAQTAKKLYLEEISEKFIHVFDSLSASVGQALVALKINELRNFSDSEITDAVSKFIKNMKTFFVLDNYDTLVKSGRMKPYLAKVAALLNMKAICGSDEGKIKFFDKARGYAAAVTNLVDRMALEKDMQDRIIGITHIKCLDKALLLRDEIVKRINFKDIFIAESGGISTVFGNKGGIVLAY